MDCMRTSLRLPTISKGASLNTWEFCTTGATTRNNFIMKFWKQFYLNPLIIKRTKIFGTPDGFMLYGKLGVVFITNSEWLYSKMKLGLRQIRDRRTFNMISDNPNVSPGIFDCSLYTRRKTPNDDYRKKRMVMLAHTSMDYKHLETLAKTFIILARKNQFNRENIFNNAPVNCISIAMIKTLHSQYRTLKTHSGINNLISD